MRVRSWYFQGWERRTDGEGKKSFVYTGVYYRLPDRFKPPALILAAALTALYLAVALLPSDGGMWHVAAIPLLLEIIPLIYLVIGGVCLARAGESMTFRDWYASWRRMKSAALWSVCFTALMAVAELVFLVLFPGKYALLRELLYLMGELGCGALSLILYLYFRKHPCAQLAAGEEKE